MPEYFFDQVVYTRDEHNYMTRQASSGYLATPKPKTYLLKSSVIYRATRELP